MAEPTVKTPIGRAPVIPVVMIGIGAYLAWFGVHYWRRDVKWPSDPVKDILTGKGPTPAGTAPPSYEAALSGNEQAVSSSQNQAVIGAVSGTPSGGIGSRGNVIATDAMQYVGKGYVWGGPADVPGDWDCSSFVSYVLGHDLGLTLPGGGHYGDQGYPPHSHGPTTLNYLLYGTPVDLTKVQAGDLLVTTEHIGIAINGTQMISAQDPQSGTGVANFTGGFPGGTPFARRVPLWLRRLTRPWGGLRLSPSSLSG